MTSVVPSRRPSGPPELRAPQCAESASSESTEVQQNAPGDAKFQEVLEAHETSPVGCVDNEYEFNGIPGTRVFMSRDLQESKDVK